MSQCKHPKKSIEVSFVASGIKKGRHFSVFALWESENMKITP